MLPRRFRTVAKTEAFSGLKKMVLVGTYRLEAIGHCEYRNAQDTIGQVDDVLDREIAW